LLGTRERGLDGRLGTENKTVGRLYYAAFKLCDLLRRFGSFTGDFSTKKWLNICNKYIDIDIDIILLRMKFSVIHVGNFRMIILNKNILRN